MSGVVNVVSILEQSEGASLKDLCSQRRASMQTTLSIWRTRLLVEQQAMEKHPSALASARAVYLLRSVYCLVLNG